MSTYNETREELVLSITSILNQTYRNLEFIIVDDNPSNDMLTEVLLEFQREDSRITLLFNQENIGLENSLNRAWKSAKGDYIARMDADDISMPDRLEKQLIYMETNDLDFVGGGIQHINENGVTISDVIFGPESMKEIKKCAKYSAFIPHPTWVMKREVMDTLNGYRNMPRCEDYDFSLRALAMGFRMGNCPMLCLSYRIRMRSISVSNADLQAASAYCLGKNAHRISDFTPRELETFLESAKAKCFIDFMNYRKKNNLWGNTTKALPKEAWRIYWKNVFFWKYLKCYMYTKVCKVIIKSKQN